MTPVKLRRAMLVVETNKKVDFKIEAREQKETVQIRMMEKDFVFAKMELTPYEALAFSKALASIARTVQNRPERQP